MTDREILDWLSSHCCAVVLRDAAGVEWTHERDEYSADDTFREFLSQLAVAYPARLAELDTIRRASLSSDV